MSVGSNSATAVGATFQEVTAESGTVVKLS